MMNCGAFIRLRHYFEHDVTRLRAATFCRERLLCQFCARGYAAVKAKAYTDRAMALLVNRPLVPLMITLTSRDSADLGAMLDLQDNAIRFILAKARRRRHGGRNVTEWSKFEGGVLRAEIKRGRDSGQWHVHQHGVVLVTPGDPGRVDLTAFTKEWAAAVGQDHANTDIRLMDGWYRFLNGDSGQLLESFLEVIKYSLKLDGLSGADAWTAYGAATGPRMIVRGVRHPQRVKVHGRRLLRSWGLFRGVEVPDDWTEDQLEDANFRDLLFRYFPGDTRYLYLGEGAQAAGRSALTPGVNRISASVGENSPF